MTTRREILKAGATALTLTSISQGAFGLGAAAGQTRVRFGTIIMDERIASNEVLSQVARVSGIKCVTIRGDLTRLWFDSLRGACLEGSATIAGFTSDLDSEVMRAFARDAGYRQELRLDITIDGETGHGTIRWPVNPARPPESALSSELETLVDCYMTLPMQARGQCGPTQLAAWVVAPIPG